MKKWLLHIFLVSVLGMLTASCSQEADDPMQTNTGSGTIRIQFSLAMDESRVSRAATWNDITGDATDNTDNDVRAIGNNYENMIDLGHLQVFLFDSNGRYLGEVGGLTLSPSSSATTYTFTGEVLVNGVDVTTEAGVKKLKDCTIMVTANYEGYVNGNLAVTQNYLFDYIADNYRPIVTGNTTSYNSYIPMWGMLKTDLPLYADRTAANTAASAANVGKIYMLRSLAKIEVNLASTVGSTYKITSAKLNKHNQAAYLLPSVPSGSTTYFAQASTSAFNTESCINAASRAIIADLDFNKVSDRQWIVYVPEYDNDGTMEITLGLENNGKDITTSVKTNVIKLNTYSGGIATSTPVDIVRNHWYQYSINTINDGLDLEFTLNVAPWTLVEKTIDYESETISGTKDDEGLGWSSCTTGTDPTEIYMLSTGADAVFKFRIDTPHYCEYYVELSGEGFELTHTKELCVDDNGQTNGATEVTVTIKATADGEYEGILRIFVKEDGRYKEVPGIPRYTIIKNYE